MFLKKQPLKSLDKNVREYVCDLQVCKDFLSRINTNCRGKDW